MDNNFMNINPLYFFLLIEQLQQEQDYCDKQHLLNAVTFLFLHLCIFESCHLCFNVSTIEQVGVFYSVSFTIHIIEQTANLTTPTYNIIPVHTFTHTFIHLQNQFIIHQFHNQISSPDCSTNVSYFLSAAFYFSLKSCKMYFKIKICEYYEDF